MTLLFAYWKEILVAVLLGLLIASSVYYQGRIKELNSDLTLCENKVSTLEDTLKQKDVSISALQAQSESNIQSCSTYNTDVSAKEVIIKRIKTKCPDNKKEIIDEKSSSDIIDYYNSHVVRVQ